MLNEPSLAILIDCWLLPYESDLQSKIINYIDSNPFITTVVLASYNCKTEFSHSKTVWYSNNRAMFNADNAPRKIKELSYVHFMHLVRDTTYAVEQTAPLLLTYCNTEKFQIAMHWAWQLEYYLSLNPEIKNVYVFGAAWGMCVKKRTLGYVALTEIQGINIFTCSNCVESSPNEHPNLDLEPDWVKVAEDTYRYVSGNTKVDG